MTDPLISVLIPAYNRAGTIARCLKSVLAAPYRALQIIVADNGSTDATLEIVRSLAASDERIEIIAHSVNRGPLPNWRSCLDRANGDLIHWLWSDDWIEPGFYRELVDAMTRRNAQVGLSAARIVCAAEGWTQIRFSLPDRGEPPTRVLQQALTGFDISPSPACALLPRSAVLTHFHSDIPLTAGLDCNTRAIGCDMLMILGCLHEARAVAFHPEPLVNFNLHQDSISIRSGSALTGAHYAWARLWWSRQQQLPRSWGMFDLLRLMRYRRFAALARSLS